MKDAANNRYSLTEGRIAPALLRFSLPFLLSYLLQGLYTNADMMIIGGFCDSTVLAAVSTGGTTMNALNALVMGLGDGVTILVGQYYGAKRQDSVRRAMGTAFTVVLAITAAVVVLLELFSGTILNIMQVPDAARASAGDYTRICYIGLLFTAGYNVSSGILRGIGDSKRPLIFVGVSCVVNILLDLLLVGAFRLGAAGAAAATVLAQCASLCASLLYIHRCRELRFDFRPKSLRPDRHNTVSLLRFGLPISMQNFLASASFMVMVSIFNRMGVTEAATAGVADKLAGLGQEPAMALSAAAAAFAAQNVGAKQMKRAGKGFRFSVLISLAVGSAFALLMVLLPGQLISLYTRDTAVIDMAWQYLYPYAAEGVLVSFVFVISGFFNGCGHTGISMAAHMISSFAVRVPLLLIIGLQPGATLLKVASAAPASSFVQMLILAGFLISGKWKIPRTALEDSKPA